MDQELLRARSDLISAFGDERISWADPGRYHVTLRFLGDINVLLVKEIGRALCSGVTLKQPASIGLNGLASFGRRRRPRVVWVGFEQTDFFDRLKSEVDQILQGCGLPSDEKPFRAHITLGRVRALQNPRKYYKIIEEIKGEFRGLVLFESLVFYRSISGRNGPEYHVLEEIPFRKNISPS
jgi:2'-5' RNA ligase